MDNTHTIDTLTLVVGSLTTIQDNDSSKVAILTYIGDGVVEIEILDRMVHARSLAKVYGHILEDLEP